MRARYREAALAVVVMAALASGTAACGGDDDDATFPPIPVEGTEMKFLPSSFPDLEAGTHTFRLINKGTVVHELAIRDSDDKPLGLGVTAKPGEEAELEVKLKKGEYLMVCQEPGHLEAGMKADITVQ